ncbi:MAG: hypothetical protein J6A59_06440 [Lachnospiraceae bacterium]|nr:hypothetical protein [Lachnospiraceae bacterium]
MVETLAKIPTPIIVGVLIIVLICALVAIIKKAVKLGIFLVGLAIVATLALPIIEKAKDDPTFHEFKEGVEHVTDMGTLFDEEYSVK